jgi:hypothetical protein
MRGVRSCAVALVLVSMAAGCSAERRPSSEPRPPGSSSEAPPTGLASTDAPARSSKGQISQARREKLDAFLSRVQFLDRVGPELELREVEYTSRTDAVAELLWDRPSWDNAGTVIATTDDSWAHASRLFIAHDLADLVAYAPLGGGAVAVKAERQSPRKNYPGFVLYPNGTTKPLRVLEPQPRESGDRLLDLDRWGSILYSIGRVDTRRLWAADIDAAEIYPVEGSRFGGVWQRVPGRDGTIMSIQGFKRRDQKWTFETSADQGHTWTTAEVPLPAGRSAGGSDLVSSTISHIAVGPGRLQATVSTTYLEDMPLYLDALWQTEDEETFRRIALPRDRPLFGGIAYASDGALLLAEVQGADTWCGAGVSGTCTRHGRMWRFAPGSTEPELLSGAPRLLGPFWAVGISTSGGVIVARTGMRTIAVSTDGYRWTEVTPGS